MATIEIGMLAWRYLLCLSLRLHFVQGNRKNKKEKEDIFSNPVAVVALSQKRRVCIANVLVSEQGDLIRWLKRIEFSLVAVCKKQRVPVCLCLFIFCL